MAKDSKGTPLKEGEEVILRAKVTGITENDTGANATFTLVGQGTKEPAPSFSGNTAFATKPA